MTRKRKSSMAVAGLLLGALLAALLVQRWELATGGAGISPSGIVVVMATIPRGSATSAEAQMDIILSDVALARPSSHGSPQWLPLAGSITRTGIGQLEAPGDAVLVQARIPVTTYSDLRLKIDGHLQQAKLHLTILANQVSPVLLGLTMVHAHGVATAQLSPLTIYVGQEQVNLGLHEAAGVFARLPAFTLVDQYGRTITNSDLSGQVTVLVPFLTQCHEACPLYTALLLQLRSALAVHHWLGQVKIVEISLDPSHDTPARLLQYARATGIQWELLTGNPAQIHHLWAPLGVSWNGANVDQHVSALVLVDQYGFVRVAFGGVPAVGSHVPQAIAKLLDSAGRQLLASGASGWAEPQVMEDIGSLLNLTPAQLGSSTNASDVAPNFTLESSSGQPVSLRALLGKPVLIDFWATWCLPCRSELPMIERAYTQHRGQRLVVLAINYGETKSQVAPFARQLQLTFPILLDPQQKVANAYGVDFLPVAIFIRPDGLIASRSVGQLDQSSLDHGLGLILN